MAGNTGTSIQENETFTTGVVPIVVGVLNPVNTAQSVWDCGVGMTYAMITTTVTGSPASFTIILEGTYDGSNWTTLATTNNTSGETRFSTGIVPFTNLRASCTAVSGGSSPTVNVFATASQSPLLATVSSNNPGIVVSQGTSSATTSLSAAVGTVTGAVADFGTMRNAATFQVVVAGAPTGGTVTFFGSLDSSTFIPLTNASTLAGTAGTLTAGVLNMSGTTNALIRPTVAGDDSFAIRYFRADVSGALTGGASPTVTVKVAAF